MSRVLTPCPDCMPIQTHVGGLIEQTSASNSDHDALWLDRVLVGNACACSNPAEVVFFNFLASFLESNRLAICCEAVHTGGRCSTPARPRRCPRARSRHGGRGPRLWQNLTNRHFYHVGISAGVHGTRPRGPHHLGPSKHTRHVIISCHVTHDTRGTSVSDDVARNACQAVPSPSRCVKWCETLRGKRTRAPFRAYYT